MGRPLIDPGVAGDHELGDFDILESTDGITTNMEELIEESWRHELAEEFGKEYFSRLTEFVEHAYATTTVFPPREKLFSAFARTPFAKTKVVIIGQDPYHEPGQAQGLAFYVPPTVKTPPSLRNIARELNDEFRDDSCFTLTAATIPDLLSWADQGVLLVNATLTVEAGKAGSHQKHGWEEFTDAVIRRLSEKRERLVFLLWGAYAQKKGAVIDRARHLVLESAHPSPLSARHGFFGNGHFRKANDYLAANSITPITW